MFDFGSIFASIATLFQDLFGAILGPLLELLSGIFPGA